MKILKVGVGPATVLWDGACRICNTTYEAVRSELKVQHDPQQVDSFATVDCEICKGKGSVIFRESQPNRVAEPASPMFPVHERQTRDDSYDTFH